MKTNFQQIERKFLVISKQIVNKFELAESKLLATLDKVISKLLEHF